MIAHPSPKEQNERPDPLGLLGLIITIINFMPRPQ
jgi:hypothetical protein